jgi:peptidyl-dipeptidase A
MLRRSGTAEILTLVCSFVASAALFACSPAGAQRPGGSPRASLPEPVAPAPLTAADAEAFVAEVDGGLREVWTRSARAAWINQNFLTEDTDSLSAEAEQEVMEYVAKTIKQATRFDGVAGISPEAARQLALLKQATVLPAPDDPKKRKELAELSVSMQSTYGKGKYCSPRLAKTMDRIETAEKKKPSRDRSDGCLPLGELSQVLEKSESWDERLEAWRGWRTVSVPLRKPYQRFAELGNEGAREIGFRDLGALWRSKYDMTPEAFEADVERLWQEVKPLYDELHCYTRARLQKRWGKDRIPDGAPIPAHLLGNMWAQQWGGVYPLVEPYPGQPSLDVTRGIRKKKLDARGMVKLGENFFTSLGMPALPQTFWERSLIEKPRDREVVCHASAWDLSYGNDVRIKMCTETTEDDLITIHHELGHNYYFTAYHQLPVLFQDGANDGFHEGIGDTLALSVTPEYLVKVGLLDKAPANDKAELNVLMRRALDKVAFLPFGKLIDQWRWDVFSGKVGPDRYNQAWWELVETYQGVAPPVARTEAEFDPGAKYHVPANTPYMRYFLAHIYQFQFHRALCKAAGHTGPLHKCSIFGSRAAGDKMWAMLQMGASRPWPDAMEAISGERRADASALLEYFAPLRAYLAEQNKSQRCGW